MAKRTTKRQSKKQYTLSEFKAWLEGIEELQPADWAPDATQWKTIRNKLLNIVEPEPVEYAEPQEPAYVPSHIPPQQPFQPPQPGGFGQSALASPEIPDSITPAAQAALSGKLPSEMVPSTATGNLKTPDIDTSDGSYVASFE